jgi:hypothetical protein
MARDVHELIAESVASIVCHRFGRDLSLRSTDDVAHWIDAPPRTVPAWPSSMVPAHR